MIDVKDIFKKKLLYNEVELSADNGCELVAINPKFGLGMDKESIMSKSADSGIKLPTALFEFYTQVEKVFFYWSIFDDPNDPMGNDSSALFKEDVWLKKQYLEKGYSWEAVKILISGQLSIASLHSLLDVGDLKQTAMFEAASKVGLDPGSLRPIDFNEYAVACFKVENGVLIDNVYLYTGFGGMPVKLHDMNITFEKYLDLAYKAKCFNYWNLVYCLREKVPNYELMKRFWPILFPHLTPDIEEFGISY